MNSIATSRLRRSSQVFATMGLVGAACGGLPASGALAAPDCVRPDAPGTHRVTVNYEGVDQSVRVHVPPSEPGQVLPMIVNVHPSDSNAEAQSAVSGLDTVADDRSFITVAADGAIRAGGPDDNPTWFWNVPGVPTLDGNYPPPDARDDVAFLTAVIDQVGARECVDTERVYMTGYSGGARMTSAYACARPDKVAAIAPVAGVRAGRPDPENPPVIEPGSCEPDQPVSVLTFHGDADPVNTYESNQDKRWGYSVQDAIGAWTKHDGCTGEPEIAPFAPGVTTEWYRSCEGGAEVKFFKIAGGNHTWPGSHEAGSTQAIRASELIGNFFSRLP